MFYDQLKRVCKQRGTSPCAVALAAGMSKSNVTIWKNGSSPKLSTVAKLAEVLGVSITELLADDVVPPRHDTTAPPS